MKRTLLALVVFIMMGGAAALAEAPEPVLVHSHEKDIEALQARYPEARALDLLPVIELTLTEAEKQALQETYPEAEFHPVLTYETAAETVPAQFGQIAVRPENTSPYTGKGVKVAVIDTGIDVDHPDLKVAGGVCTMKTGCSRTKPYDDDDEMQGHGTHVAGILAAQKNGIGIVGIAPDIELYAVKALDATGGGPTTAVVAGLEWAIENDMDIVNMSISISEDDTVLKMMLQKAADAGILLVSAAGNKGGHPDAGVTYPGKHSSVIAVSAVTKDNAFLPISSSGKEVELTAPGEAIYSTTPKELDWDGPQDGYRSLSGTSMAAPHVTGILSLYKEQFPGMPAKKLREIVTATAKDLGPKGRDDQFGHGLVTYKKQITEVPYLDYKAENGRIDVSLANANQTANRSLKLDGAEIAETAPGVWELYRLAGTYKAVLSYTGKDGTARQEKMTIDVPSPSFPDIAKAKWYADEIAYLTHKSWIFGYTDKTFRPDRQITRGEALMLLGRAYGLDGEQRDTVFSDIGRQNRASGFVQSAYEEGLLVGFPDGTFRPDQPVTRAEMAILLSGAYSLPYDESVANPFPDVAPGMQAYEAIQSFVQSNVTVGYKDGTFRPDDYMTRATYSVFLAKIDRPELFQ